VIVEKPLAVNNQHLALMKALVEKYKIHLLTNFETTWYASHAKVWEMAKQNKNLGEIKKVVFRMVMVVQSKLAVLKNLPIGSQILSKWGRSDCRFWLLWCQYHDLANGWSKAYFSNCCNPTRQTFGIS
jgi:NAD dependent epimerase/dehydratase family enzyme